VGEHHDDESFVDKIKGALGMGSSEHDADARHDERDRSVGVGAGTRTDDMTAGTADRPAGPDYGARDPGSDLGSDFEDPRDAGTTRGGAASGESPFGSETDAPDTDRRGQGV
jgi:hypothetical protein